MEKQEKEIVWEQEEQDFLDNFKRNSGSSIKTLLGLYKGHYVSLFFSVLFFFIKHSPVWILPIVTSNIINIATNPDENVVRRSSLVRKLQQLSISYHNAMQSGRLQSKIMRDVEQIETLSRQIFISVLSIIMNIAVALGIVVSKSLTVFVFFVLTVPVAVIIMVVFKNKIKLHNRQFRKDMEETSVRVMEMVELIPVTRAHALESTETMRMQEQLDSKYYTSPKSPYHLPFAYHSVLFLIHQLGGVSGISGVVSGLYRLSGCAGRDHSG